jgi:hypothetical protein
VRGVTRNPRKAACTRTAAHSCRITRKSAGGDRATAATTELSALADDADDVSHGDAPPLDLDADDELLRNSRVHFRPCPCAASAASAEDAGCALMPTSDLIHFPDPPIVAARSQHPLSLPARRSSARQAATR